MILTGSYPWTWWTHKECVAVLIRSYKNNGAVLTFYCSRVWISCLYEVISHEQRDIVSCGSMSHLYDCENEQCRKGTFKCPQYYCVHLRYVCDGYFDCPFGYEEHNCKRSSMPQMFHCVNTSIFIAPQSVCDTIVDCPVGDDELSCDIARLKCPYTCDCLRLWGNFWSANNKV